MSATLTTIPQDIFREICSGLLLPDLVSIILTCRRFLSCMQAGRGIELRRIDSMLISAFPYTWCMLAKYDRTYYNAVLTSYVEHKIIHLSLWHLASRYRRLSCLCAYVRPDLAARLHWLYKIFEMFRGQYEGSGPAFAHPQVYLCNGYILVTRRPIMCRISVEYTPNPDDYVISMHRCNILVARNGSTNVYATHNNAHHAAIASAVVEMGMICNVDMFARIIDAFIKYV